MRTITVGTSAIQLLHPNANRTRWTLTFTPSSIAAGNTGKIFVGRGFVPIATVGDANQGDVLNAGSSIEEKKSYKEDDQPYKGAVWIISDTASQQITVDEQQSDTITPA